MTVKELIERLSSMPQDVPVARYAGGDRWREVYVGVAPIVSAVKDPAMGNENFGLRIYPVGVMIDLQDGSYLPE